jgi:hypothetical protein
MRTFFVAIVAIAVLVSACLFSACVSEKTVTPTPVLNSTTPVPTPTPDPQQSPYISFEEAKNRLGEYLDMDPMTNPDGVKSYKRSGENISIRFIQGVNFDASGNARMWAFGTRTENGTQLRAIDRSGWTIITLNEPFASGEIILDRVISPAALFEQNRVLISGTSPPEGEVRQVELKDGIYSVTIGRPPRIMMFNATTGAPIE